jgi:hypothetical protein
MRTPLAVCLSFFALGASGRCDPGVIGSVNGQPIVAIEIEEAGHEASAAQAISPTELSRRAQAICVRDAVLEQMALARGLLRRAGYSERRQRFDEENAARQSATDNDRVIFGPKRLRWAQYRLIWREKLELALQRALAAEHPVPSPQTLQEYYRLNPARFTAPGEEAPRAFADEREHVLRLFLLSEYERAVATKVGTAKVVWCSDPAIAC